ncbi:hypothetical protein WA026_004257 [Henosepilachna vigintioctopunctata]|uniref:Uncharacterized protein n=1 Tax=Henosepilachna vigintioctopunctata TaxID=420089 RepID=A0AAW1V6E9_9CUCU
MKKILKTNAAISSPKYTNTFQESGVVIQVAAKDTTKSVLEVLYFHYVPLSSKSIRNTIKAIRVIVIRGPNHTKNPTDRIPFVTLELFLKDSPNKFLIQHMNKGFFLENNNFYVLVRPNFIMKEDTSYMTFTSNYLFNPIDMFGLLTLEDVNVDPNCNMKEKMTSLLSTSS